MASKKMIEIEFLKLKREKARIVLCSSITLYIFFMAVGFVGYVLGYIDSQMLNAFVVIGLVVLIFGTFPYMRHVALEEKKLKEYLK